MKHSKSWIFLVIFSATILFSGCFKNSKPTEIKVVFPNATWNRFAPMDAQFEIDKLDKEYEIVVYLRVIKGFELEEVPIEIVITSPDGQQNIMDRNIMIKKDGNYIGNAVGDVWTSELLVYSAKQFPQTGTYSIFIQNRTQYYDLHNTESLSFVVRLAKKK